MKQILNSVESVPKQLNPRVEYVLRGNPVIDAVTVVTWIDRLGVSAADLMVLLLPVAAAFSRSPLSKHSVGAVAMGTPDAGRSQEIGALYLGASFEFPDQQLVYGIHAEQSAVNNAWLHNEKGIAVLAASSSPCGHCRQFLYELPSTEEFIVLFKDSEGSVQRRGLQELLPAPFGPDDLGIRTRLMASVDARASHSPASDFRTEVARQARLSYAPYSGAQSAVGLRRPDGSVVIGRYAENAAYNPSLSACESAISQLNLTQAAQSTLSISYALLAETLSAPISFLRSTEDMVSSLMPKCTVERLVLEP